MAVNALLSPVERAHAADVKVLSSVALTSVLDEFTPEFEKATVNKLNIGYGLVAELKKRILPDRIQHMHERLQEIVALQSAKSSSKTHTERRV
jgi:hypothetical protein